VKSTVTGYHNAHLSWSPKVQQLANTVTKHNT